MKNRILTTIAWVFMVAVTTQVMADTKPPSNPTMSKPQSVKINPPASGTQLRGPTAAQNTSQLNEVSMLRREVEQLKRELTQLRREIHQHRHEIRNAQAVTVHDFETNKTRYRSNYIMLLQAGSGSSGTPRTKPPIESFSR